MIYPFKFDQWYPEDEETDYTVDERIIVPMVIGLINNHDGGEKKPVVELMYNDIVGGVADGIYQLVSNTGNVPPVIFTYLGQVLIHNDEMPSYRESIGKALDEYCSAEDKIEGLIELANSNEGATVYSKGTALKEICDRVRRKTEIDYNPELIIDVLKENMKGHEVFRNPIRDKLALNSEEEMIRLTGALKAYMITGASRNEEIKALIKEYGMDAVKEAICLEMTDRRFFTRKKAGRR